MGDDRSVPRGPAVPAGGAGTLLSCLHRLSLSRGSAVSPGSADGCLGASPLPSFQRPRDELDDLAGAGGTKRDVDGFGLFLTGSSCLQEVPFLRCGTCLRPSENASLPAPSTSLFAVAFSSVFLFGSLHPDAHRGARL